MERSAFAQAYLATDGISTSYYPVNTLAVNTHFYSLSLLDVSAVFFISRLSLIMVDVKCHYMVGCGVALYVDSGT